MIIATKPKTELTLEDFLTLKETKHASELIDGEIYQKPMPQCQHSLIQGRLCETINLLVRENKIACAFPELRCTFDDKSIVPDIAVIRWGRIPLDEKGRIVNRFETYPDWAIEILSPEQSLTQVLAKLLHCSRQGTELSWLINPDEEAIFVVFPEQKIELYQEENILPVLEGIEGLKLTAEIIFSWLKFNGN
ncbi:Uma2 family endonuclease [Geminocystis sp. GBBB08]|uniref:Uma2 family endonuclease n=1 Tax=Geminocystis sp. GBBB08 TaxID=2604140 RepID=UPI0027E2B506|nr:Uma2 family endonuclease [Geminocystis sp. GBBB08]MBL1209421.1 Uma2 family endonuclease [Geminocystis sp. GBBB08]